MPTSDWFTPEYAINMASNPKDVTEVHTLEFNHPAFIEGSTQVPIRVVGDLQDWTGKLEAAAPFNPGATVTFTAIGFNFEDPDQTEGRAQEARISMDNVGRELSKYLDDALGLNSPIQVIYRRYLSDDHDTIVSGPFYLNLSEVLESSTTVQGTLAAFRPEYLKMCRKTYDLVSYPGLIAIS